MNLLNPNPLPLITKEISMQEKRMRTIQSLEKALLKFANEVKAINSICPFGADSLEVQTAVNGAGAWANGFSKYLVKLNNHVILSHSEAMQVLAEDQDILDPTELAEDKVALLKSHLTPELAASREVRQHDLVIQKEFETKLKKLESEFKKASRLPMQEANIGNAHYSVVD